MADAGAAPLVRSSPVQGDAVSRPVEFLLVGGATLFLFPLLWLLRARVGLDAAELAVGFVGFHAAFVINDPHFAVTYLLFYRDARRRLTGDAFAPIQRARWAVAGVVVPVSMAAWVGIALGTHSARALGALIQLMFFLVGWHYVKQAFGVLSVLSARRGVLYGPVERAALLGHCFAAWAYGWASPADPGNEVEEKGVVYVSLAHGRALELATWCVFVASGLWLLVMLARKARRERRLPPLAPLVGYLVTLWLWTAYSGIDPLMLYLIPALHSLQYLYFVGLMRRNEAAAAEGPPEFGRPVALRVGGLALSALGLGLFLFHVAPGLLDAARATRIDARGDAAPWLGATPWFAALYTFVNLHHYCMDWVIWRRDNPETRFLRGTAA